MPCYGLCDCPNPRSIYLNGGYSNISLKQILLHIFYFEIEIKGGIKYLALPAFKINFRAISALASSSPITIQTTSVLIFRHKTIFCLKSTKEELYVIYHWIQKGPLNYNAFDTLKILFWCLICILESLDLIVRYDYINVVKSQIYENVAKI